MKKALWISLILLGALANFMVLVDEPKEILSAFALLVLGSALRVELTRR